MKRSHFVATLAALTMAFGATTTAQALEQSKPPRTLDTGAGLGAGDPSLGGTRMPPGGDKAGVDAAERAEKIAERKAKEAEKRREEERKRKAAADAAAASKNDNMKRALSPALTPQYGSAAPPIARVASAPALTSTTATRRAGLAPSALSR